MNKYMVFLPGDAKPEIIEADGFEITTMVLQFHTSDGLTAAFYSWIGVKQLVDKPKLGNSNSAVVTFTTTAIDPTS